MAWEHIIGQDTLKAMLQQSICSGRVPQALLLTGSRGMGSAALAIEFARTVNCYSPLRGTTTVAACGTCQSCQQSKTLQHPNITILSALPSGKFDQTSDVKEEVLDEVREQLALLSADPYSSYRITNANQIRIWQIRELKRSLALSTLQKGRRVVVVLDADLMNAEAANGFLKTLEEPHPDTTIILTTAYRDKMMPTIISRCQELRLPPIDEQSIIDGLLHRGECDETEARLTASYCNGDFSTALEFLHEDLHEVRNDVVEMLRSALRGRDYRLGLTDSASILGDARDKEKALMYLRFMAIWLRDTFSVAQCGTTSGVINQDLAETLQKFATAFAGADLSRALLAIDQACYDIKHHVSITLTISTLLIELRSILASAKTR